MFGAEPVEVELDAVLAAREKSVQIDAKAVRTTRTSDYAKQLSDFIDQSSRATLIFTGHNRDGRLMFPDGTSRGLEDIARQCALRGKVGIFLSCKSTRYVRGRAGQYGVPRRLTYAEALCVAEKLHRTVGTDVMHEFSHINGNLADAIKECLASDVAVGIGPLASVSHGLILGGVIVGAIVVYQVVVSSDKNSAGK